MNNRMDKARDWQRAGYELPADLVRVLDLLDAIQDAVVAHGPALPAFDTLSPDDVGRVLDKLSADYAAHNAREDAHKALLRLAEAEVARATREATPAVLGQMRRAFNTAADTFVNSVAKLPATLDADTVATLSTEALTAYGEAKAAAEVIRSADAFVARLRSGLGNSESTVVCRVLNPATYGELDKLISARTGNHTRIEREIGSVYLAAARNGVPFELSANAAEPAERAGALEAQRQADFEASRKDRSGPSRRDVDFLRAHRG